MGCVLLPVLMVLPILALLLLLNVITVSYGELGLSPNAAIALLVSTLVGSMVNIPISTRQIEYEEPQTFLSRFFFYTPPRVTTQTVAVNLGGALIPTGFAIYLIPRAPLPATLVATVVMVLISRLLARLVPGMGIVMPAFIPPLVSAGLALLLARSHPAPVGYISGTLGTLIGADLLNWPNYKKLRSHVISIGGAGVFDGVFLAGMLAVVISSF
jgi:uncharacterized membrane protein